MPLQPKIPPSACLKTPLVIFGGTFDPIHRGHLQVAARVHQQCNMPTITFVPCYQSPFKSASQANAQHRLRMIQLVIDTIPYLKVDSFELEQRRISLTINTLLHFNHDSNEQKILLLGSDAFNSFTFWHRWQEILKLTAIIVISRSSREENFSSTAMELLKRHRSNTVHNLVNGSIYLLAMDPLPIASTTIRTLAKRGQAFDHLVPQAVAHYIHHHHLYKD